MSDELDRLLKSSLTHVGEDFEAGHQERRPEARAEFIRRYNKRRWVFPTMVAVGATAAVAAIVFIGASVLGGGSPADLRPEDGNKPFRAQGRPGFELTIPVGGTPTDVVGLGGGIWVTNPELSNVARIDANTAELVDTVELGGRPSVISFGPRYVWVGDPGTGQIYAIDPATNEVIRGPFEIGDPDEQMALSIGEEHVWVVMNEKLFLVDDESGQATLIPEADRAVDVAAVSGPVWVLDRRQGLMRFDGSTGAPIDEPIPVGGRSGDVFATTEHVFLADREDDSIIGVDADTGNLVRQLGVNGSYIDVAFGPDVMWVLSRVGENTQLTAYSPTKNRRLAPPLRLGGDATELAVSRGAVWATLSEQGQVIRIGSAEFLDR
jgi:hypothetical protein